jgi:EmrB/QacA subfamily drug resistance transporter
MTQFVVVIDGSIINVALPSIGASLKIAEADLSWVVNAYALAFGGFLLLGGRLADFLGRRRMFIAGIAIFTLASLLGGFAQNSLWLDSARALQGFGAALASPAALSLITTIFTEGRERGRAIAVWGATAGAGGAAGVLLGGVLTQYLGWEWVLFVNVPLGAFIIWQAPLRLPAARDALERTRFDFAGAVLVTSGLAALVYTFVAASTDGWASVWTWTRLGTAVVLLIAFVIVELRSAAPLVPFSIFRLQNLRGGNIIGLLLGMALNSMFFLLTLYLQRVLSFDALQAGLAFLPLALSIVLASILASQLIERIGAKATLTTALVMMTIALAWFSRVHADGSFPVDTLGPSILIGLGFGGCLVSVTTIATNGVPREEAGLASGLINASQQVGGALGLAIIVSVAASVTKNSSATGASALTAGYQAAFLVGAGIVLLGTILSAVLLTNKTTLDDPAGSDAPGTDRLSQGHNAALTTESDHA